MPDDDAALAGRLTADADASVLELLYRRHGGACYALAKRIVVDPVLAQDAVQEAFLALWRGGFDSGRGTVLTWLLAVTHHRAVDLARREEKHRRRQPPDVVLHQLQESVADPVESAMASARDRQVRSALAGLSHEHRQALVLAYYGGYTQREIAVIAGVPLGTVKTRTMAALRRLREQLRPERGDG